MLCYGNQRAARLQNGDLSQMKTIGRAIVIAVFATLVVAAPAQADDCANPSICQYVEQIPTAKGAKPSGRTAKKVAALPAPVEKAIRTEGGGDVQVLQDLATSSSYGAPRQVPVQKVEKNRPQRKQLERELQPKNVQEDAEPIPAAVGAVSGGGNGRLLALVIAMGAMTAIAVALATLRHRSARR